VGQILFLLTSRDTDRVVAYITALNNCELISLIVVCVRPHYDVDLQSRHEQHLLSWKKSSHGFPHDLMWTVECEGMRMGDRNGEMIYNVCFSWGSGARKGYRWSGSRCQGESSAIRLSGVRYFIQVVLGSIHSATNMLETLIVTGHFARIAGDHRGVSR
jgi:hypothetical protein